MIGERIRGPRTRELVRRLVGKNPWRRNWWDQILARWNLLDLKHSPSSGMSFGKFILLCSESLSTKFGEKVLMAEILQHLKMKIIPIPTIYRGLSDLDIMFYTSYAVSRISEPSYRWPKVARLAPPVLYPQCFFSTNRPQIETWDSNWRLKGLWWIQLFLLNGKLGVVSKKSYDITLWSHRYWFGVPNKKHFQ